MRELILNFYRFIFSRKVFYKFNTTLYYLSLRGLGINNYTDLKASGENFFIKNNIKKQADKYSKYIVFDVGANQGNYTELLLKNINNIYVYAFEPHPITFKKLNERFITYNNIKLFNVALSDKIGDSNIYDYLNNDGSTHASLKSQVFSDIHYQSHISHSVLTSTIDQMTNDNNVEFIHFLKIDVEGMEYEVLKGAKKMITNKKISIIQFEFTKINAISKVFFKDFWDMLSNNYKIYRLLPKGLLQITTYDPTINEIFGFHNYVAIINDK